MTFPGLDLYCADPAQPPTTAGEELDGLDDDPSVRRMKACSKQNRSTGRAVRFKIEAEAWLRLDTESLRGGLAVVPKADHPTRTLTLTLWGRLYINIAYKNPFYFETE